MYLSQHERVRHFDAYVDAVDQTMRSPEIAAKLGILASRVLQINEQAFLPNIRFGRTSVPRAFRDNFEATAIMPLGSRAEYQNAAKLNKHILNAMGPIQPLPPEEMSRLEMDGTAALQNVSNKMHNNGHANREPETSEGYLDIASTHQRWITYKKGGIATSRSVLSVFTPLVPLEDDVWNRTAFMGHEEIHAWDQRYDISTISPRGLVASELRGYHITDATLDMSPSPDPILNHAHAIEDWRQQNLGDNFVPDDTQLAAFGVNFGYSL